MRISCNYMLCHVVVVDGFDTLLLIKLGFSLWPSGPVIDTNGSCDWIYAWSTYTRAIRKLPTNEISNVSFSTLSYMNLRTYSKLLLFRI